MIVLFMKLIRKQLSVNDPADQDVTKATIKTVLL